MSMESLSLKEKEDKTTETFLQDIIKGLSSKPKRVPSRYLYDAKGDEYFRNIMNLDEYYLTRCEKEVLHIYKEELLRICCDNEPFKLVDLGAGDGTKTEILIDYFLKKEIDFEFIAIDISKSALEYLINRLQSKYPKLRAKGINAEYTEGLKQIQHLPEKKFLLFLGSNLGNFEFRDAVSFLKKLHENLNQNDMLLLGLDLKKAPSVIIDAYDDHKEVTAGFNYNLLDRINSELDADFNKPDFIHQVSYDPVSGEVKTFLISTKKQQVNIGKADRKFSFEKWEALQTECSNKYDMESIVRLASEAGFQIGKSFFDSKGYFTDTLWKKG